MKTILSALCCLMTTFCFAQATNSGAAIPPPTSSDIIACLQAPKSTSCYNTPPYIPVNPTLLRGAASPSQAATDFVNYFASGYSTTLAASSKDAAQIFALSQKQEPYPNLAAFIKANPQSEVAATVQSLINSSKTYDDFQAGLTLLYGWLTNQNDKNFVYGLSNALDVVNQSAQPGGASRVAVPGCTGWWSCWGSCAAAVLGGLTGGGLYGAIAGTAVPGIGTIAGGVLGGIAGALNASVSACK